MQFSCESTSRITGDSRICSVCLLWTQAGHLKTHLKALLDYTTRDISPERVRFIYFDQYYPSIFLFFDLIKKTKRIFSIDDLKFSVLFHSSNKA
jgi:hypothetical protein